MEKINIMSPPVNIWQPELLEKTFKFADFISKSDIIPAAFQGKPANVFIACQLAQRLNTNPMEIMQNMYVVKGNPAFKTSYLIARANAESFKSPLVYVYPTEVGFTSNGEKGKTLP